jgi:diketogulonate reductase-like aldo/keto reductase
MISRKKFITLLSILLYSLKPKTLLSETMNNTKIPLRETPSSKEKIPVLGLGTWRTFDIEPNEQNIERLHELILAFHSHGGKLIDSSPMYGKAESMIGAILEKYGKGDYFLATKVWTSGKKEGQKQIENSFQKMKTKFIELFQVHNLVDLNNQLSTLRELKEKGLIRYIGVTHYTTSSFESIEAIIKKENLDFIQIPYSISLRDAESKLLPFAKDKGVAVLVNRPFEGGELFSNFLQKPIDTRLIEIGIESWAELFIRYILSNKNVTCILFATSKLAHLNQNMNSAKKPLLTTKDLEKAYKIFIENAK